MRCICDRQLIEEHSGEDEEISVRTITASEAKQTAEGTNDLRLAFELVFSRKLSEEYRAIDTHHFVDYTFLDTTFEKLGV